MKKVFSLNPFIINYSSIIPYLLDFQKKSFISSFCIKDSNYYLKNSIKKIFPLFSKNYLTKVCLSRIKIKKPCNDIGYCLLKKLTYSLRIYLYLNIYRLNKVEGLFYVSRHINKRYLFCDMPCLLNNASFLINGLQRTIVSQIYKSPGVYITKDKVNGNIIFKIIPLYGSWLEFIIDKKKRINFRINGKKKINIIVLLRCFGLSLNQIFNSFTSTIKLRFNNENIFIGFNGKNFKNEKFVRDIYDKNLNVFIKKGTKTNNFNKIFGYIILDKKYYSNLIVSEETRIKNRIFKTNSRLNVNKLFSTFNKNINLKGTIKVFDFFKSDSNKFLLNSFFVKGFIDKKESLIKLYKSCNQNKNFNEKILDKFFFDNFFDHKNFFLSNYVRKKLNKKIFSFSDSNLINSDDIIGIVKFLLGSNFSSYRFSDIDSLENKRVKGIGQFIFNLIEKKLFLLKLSIIEKISDKKNINFNNIVSNRIINTYIKEFFCVSQFSQFMDQNNDLAELTHKRRITSLGPGGIGKGMVNISVRDIHFSNYGRLCPIETPEGHNIGLVNSFSILSKINNDFFIESPYFLLKKNSFFVKFCFLDSFYEYNTSITSILNYKKLLSNNRKFVLCRKHGRIFYSYISEVKYFDITSIQIFSLASLLIPFMEHNDANRSLMGSNMQRQSIVGIEKNKPYVSTGLEFLPSIDLGYIFFKGTDKKIYLDSKRIIFKNILSNYIVYKIVDFIKFSFSNQKNLVNNKIYNFRNKVSKSIALNDNNNTNKCCLSIGQNLLVAFITYKGYNFEDSIIVSDKLVNSYLYTSIHYNEIVVNLKKNSCGNKYITNKNIFYINKNNYKKLDSNGIAKVGYYYSPGDIIVARLKPKNQSDLSPEERLSNSILNKKFKNLCESFIRLKGYSNECLLTKLEIIDRKKIDVFNGNKLNNFNSLSYCSKIIAKNLIRNFIKKINCFYGIKLKYFYFSKFRIFISKRVNKKVFYRLIIINNRLKKTKNNIFDSKIKNYSFRNNVYRIIRMTFCYKRKLSIGDKMSGRHGNKGVISKIIPFYDMPFLKDGTRCDIILNPLGIPSRMNLGQLYELKTGFIIFGILKRIKDFIIKKNKKKIINFIKKIGIKLVIKKKNLFNYNFYKNNLSFLSIPFEGFRNIDLNIISKIVFNKNLSKKILIDKNREKVKMFNGKTGMPFDNYVSFGYMYFLKLHHTSYDKIHSRSIGPYSLVTQQPLKGKSKLGGQRFGEMEVWALEAYGAAYTLREMLTIKSDDIKGRKVNYNRISLGIDKKINFVPESFNILLKEMRALCLDVKIL